MVLSELIYVFDDSEVRLGNIPGVRKGFEGFHMMQFESEGNYAHGFILCSERWQLDNMLGAAGINRDEIYINRVDANFFVQAVDNDAFKEDLLKIMPDLTNIDVLFDLVNKYGWLLDRIRLDLSDDEIIEWASKEDIPELIQTHFSHLFEPSFEPEDYEWRI